MLLDWTEVYCYRNASTTTTLYLLMKCGGYFHAFLSELSISIGCLCGQKKKHCILIDRRKRQTSVPSSSSYVDNFPILAIQKKNSSSWKSRIDTMDIQEDGHSDEVISAPNIAARSVIDVHSIINEIEE